MGHAGGLFGGDEAAAFFAGLWTTDTIDRAVDAGIIILAAAILGWQGYKRPKMTGGVAAVWLLWFVCKIAEGQSAWSQLSAHVQRARGSTEDAVRATGGMLAAWTVLFMPIAVDAERALAPVASEAGRALLGLWDLLTWQQRGLLALCALALGGTTAAAVSAAAAVHRHRDALAAALFQLSFAVCGPSLWWFTAQLPEKCSSLLVSAVVSVAPTVLSLRALLQLERERESAGAGYKPLQKTGSVWASVWPPEGQHAEDKDLPSVELQERMCAWLSYWSCWPFFHLACMMLRSTELVSDEAKPAADGLLLALAAWVQVWQASRIAPYIFTACAGCLSRLSEQASEATSAAGSSAANLALRLWQAGGQVTLGEQGGRWAVVVGVAAVVLVLANLVLHAMALASALLTLGILMGMAFDSARCAARCNSEALPSRLVFWVVSTSWLWLCGLPVGGALLGAWTPLVLAVAAAAGELLLKVILGVLRAASAALLFRRNDCKTVEAEEVSTPGERDGALLEEGPGKAGSEEAAHVGAFGLAPEEHAAE